MRILDRIESGGIVATTRGAGKPRHEHPHEVGGSRDRRVFLRDMEAGRHLEIFFTAAVAAILAIRTFLRLTGYPQLGSAHFHVAHVLWGGLLMCAAIVTLLSFTTRNARTFAALCGGVGFGTFIDEAGKFVTRDVDYFYRPTFALIYVIFVLAILASRVIRTARTYTQAEYLVNSLISLQPIATDSLDSEGAHRARRYLGLSDPSNPIVSPLRELFRGLTAFPHSRPGLISRTRDFLLDRYRAIASNERFADAVVLFFVTQQSVSVLYVAGLIFLRRTHLAEFLDSRFFERFAQRIQSFSVVDYAEITSSLISTALVIIGIVEIRRSRLAGLRMFKHSVLVSIFLTQVFTFYRERLWALLWLAFYVVVLVTLDFVVERELSAQETTGEAGL
jgi:hypothetical protein